MEHETNNDADFKRYGLKLDPEIRTDIFGKFLEANPEFSDDELRSFGARTAIESFKKKGDTKETKNDCVVFPLYDENGEIVNYLLFDSSENIISSERPFVLRKGMDGIICSRSDANKLKDGFKSIKHAYFANRLEDVIAFSSTNSESDAENIFIFSIDGADPNTTFRCYDCEFYYPDEEDDDDPYQLAYEISRTFVRKGVNLALLGIAGKQLEYIQLMANCIDGDVLCLPEVIAGKPFGSIYEFIVNGGTIHVIRLLQKTGHNDLPKNSRDAKGSQLHTCFVQRLFSGRKLIKYACADEGSPLRKLDFTAATITALAGPTGIGKTALTASLVCEAALRNKGLGKILYVNTDQHPDSLFEREVSRITGIPYQDIYLNRLNTSGYYKLLDEQFEKIQTVMKKIYYFNTSSFEQIERKIQSLGPQLIVLDHIQAISVHSRSGKKIEQMELLMERLLNLIQSGRSIFLVAALNRDGARRAEYGPLSVDAIRDSSAIEYIATNIWFLRKDSNRKGSEQYLLLENAKQKESAKSKEAIPLLFDGAHMRFSIAEPPKKPECPKRKNPRKTVAPKVGVPDEDGGVL